MSIYYGATSEKNILDCIKIACTALNGSNVPESIKFLSEICAAETWLGSFRDGHALSGYGLFQYDLPRWKNDIQRLAKERPKVVEIFNNHGFDLIGLAMEPKESIRCLDYSPLLSAFACRASLLLLPDAIPKNRYQRAVIWKRDWNTYAEGAAGTIWGYMSKANRYLGVEV